MVRLRVLVGILALLGCAAPKGGQVIPAQYYERYVLMRESTIKNYDYEIEAGNSSHEMKADCLQQLEYFYGNFARFLMVHPGKFVAVANEQVFVGDSLVEAEQRAMGQFPNRQIYVGPIPPAVIPKPNWDLLEMRNDR